MAASFATKIPGLTPATLAQILQGALSPIQADLPSHEREVEDAAQSAIRKYGRAIQSTDRPLWVADNRGGEKPGRAAFVEQVMQDHRFLATRDNDEVFVYREGYYSARAKTLIREWVEDRFKEHGETSSTAFTSEVIGGVTRRCYVDRSQFNPLGKLCLENGFIDLTTLAVSPHNPDIPFTYQLPVRYDPGAICPTFERFLSEVVPAELVP